jgi:hypothetical protein
MPLNLAMRQPPIDGAKIRMGGEDWVVPPLNLRAVRLHEQMIKDIQTVGSQFEGLPKIAAVALAALQRNYPELTLEQVEDLLDMGNALSVFRAIIGQSGFEEARPGGASAGETQAASEQTGTTSTGS